VCKKKPQISPLRCAPVEMTNLLHGKSQFSSGCAPRPWLNKFVISTGAQRSGEICGFFLHTLFSPRGNVLQPIPQEPANEMCHPDWSVAKWRDLLFSSATIRPQMGAPPSPLSSRAKPRDLRFHSTQNQRLGHPSQFHDK
jgi:hypothetical protein